MAEKRMFAQQIIDSDAFLDMPTSTQALYFHLAMRADDDGFVNNPKKIQRMIGCSEDDMKLLLAKSFILAFESGIIVIKHWRIHNTIQKDRYKQTAYKDELSMLQVKENKSYTFCIQDGNGLYSECIQNVSRMDTQVRLDKVSLDKIRLDKDRIASTTTGAELWQNRLEAAIKHHWKREATEQDIKNALQYVTDDDSFQMLANALELSGRREEAANWAYVRAIYDSWKRNGITNDLELIQHEIARRDGLK